MRYQRSVYIFYKIPCNRKSVDDCFEETLDLIRGLARTLNNDDCYKYTEKLKKWFNKGGI